jgi:putative tricarboxylic transport membrane protein
MPTIRQSRLNGASPPEDHAGAEARAGAGQRSGTFAIWPNRRGIVGAKGLGAAPVAYWEGVFAKVTATEEWNKRLVAQSWVGNYLPSREFVKFLENDYNQTRAVMTDLGIVK